MFGKSDKRLIHGRHEARLSGSRERQLMRVQTRQTAARLGAKAFGAGCKRNLQGRIWIAD